MAIINGLLSLDSIKGVTVVIDLIPTTNKKARPAFPMKATSITIHNTGNSRRGADGKAHTEYVDKVNSYVSWHFTVDDKAIYQELPITENAWHGGDGGEGEGNRTSIAIEICEHEGIDWLKAKQNAIKLIRYLKAECNIEYVYPHQHWNGKYCPHRILDEGWNNFISAIDNSYIKELEQANKKIAKLQDRLNKIRELAKPTI